MLGWRLLGEGRGGCGSADVDVALGPGGGDTAVSW